MIHHKDYTGHDTGLTFLTTLYSRLFTLYSYSKAVLTESGLPGRAAAPAGGRGEAPHTPHPTPHVHSVYSSAL